MLSFARPNSAGKGANGAADLMACSDAVSSNSWPDEAMTREFAREPFSIIENSITVVPLSPRMKASSGYDHVSSIFFYLNQIRVVLRIRAVKIYRIYGAVSGRLSGIFGESGEDFFHCCSSRRFVQMFQG